MHVLVSYDIVDNRRRSRTMKALKDYGHRVQLSVFECDLDIEEYRRMKMAVERLIDEKEDRIRYYRLCRGCLDRIVISGWGEVTTDDGVWII